MLRLMKHANQHPDGTQAHGSLRNLRRPSLGPDSDDVELELEPLSPQAGRYSDKFVEIDPETNTLTLKQYLLIGKPIRRIHIPNILYITSASDVHWIGVKLEGLSVTGILWALDWSRRLSVSSRRNGYVIKVLGDIFRLGFSVERPRQFVEALEYVCPALETIGRT